MNCIQCFITFLSVHLICFTPNFGVNIFVENFEHDEKADQTCTHVWTPGGWVKSWLTSYRTVWLTRLVHQNTLTHKHISTKRSCTPEQINGLPTGTVTATHETEFITSVLLEKKKNWKKTNKQKNVCWRLVWSTLRLCILFKVNSLHFLKLLRRILDPWSKRCTKRMTMIEQPTQHTTIPKVKPAPVVTVLD